MIFLLNNYIFIYYVDFFYLIELDINIHEIYYRTSQEWQWRNIVFTIAKEKNNVYTLLDLARMDRPLVY